MRAKYVIIVLLTGLLHTAAFAATVDSVEYPVSDAEADVRTGAGLLGVVDAVSQTIGVDAWSAAISSTFVGDGELGGLRMDHAAFDGGSVLTTTYSAITETYRVSIEGAHVGAIDISREAGLGDKPTVASYEYTYNSFLNPNQTLVEYTELEGGLTLQIPATTFTVYGTEVTTTHSIEYSQFSGGSVITLTGGSGVIPADESAAILPQFSVYRPKTWRVDGEVFMEIMREKNVGVQDPVLSNPVSALSVPPIMDSPVLSMTYTQPVITQTLPVQLEDFQTFGTDGTPREVVFGYPDPNLLRIGSIDVRSTTETLVSIEFLYGGEQLSQTVYRSIPDSTVLTRTFTYQDQPFVPTEAPLESIGLQLEGETARTLTKVQYFTDQGYSGTDPANQIWHFFDPSSNREEYSCDVRGRQSLLLREPDGSITASLFFDPFYQSPILFFPIHDMKGTRHAVLGIRGNPRVYESQIALLHLYYTDPEGNVRFSFRSDPYGYDHPYQYLYGMDGVLLAIDRLTDSSVLWLLNGETPHGPQIRTIALRGYLDMANLGDFSAIPIRLGTAADQPALFGDAWWAR